MYMYMKRPKSFENWHRISSEWSSVPYEINRCVTMFKDAVLPLGVWFLSLEILERL